MNQDFDLYILKSYFGLTCLRRRNFYVLVTFITMFKNRNVKQRSMNYYWT